MTLHDPYGLPRQRRGTTPQMHGRYPDFDVLEQADHWDEATRKVILARVHEVPPIRFFTPDELPTVRAFCDDVLAQDAEPRIPVVEMIDARLHARRFDGFRYAGMPDDAEVWRAVVGEFAALGYADLPRDRRVALVKRLAAGDFDWPVDAGTAWKVVMRIALAEFYSHPWAWNEIGFGGPAYPRGYARLGINMSESWEGEPAFDLDPVRDVRERGVED